MRTVLATLLLTTLVACGGGGTDAEDADDAAVADACARIADAVPTGDLPTEREWKRLRRKLDEIADAGGAGTADLVAPFRDPVDRLVADPIDLNKVVRAMGDLDDALQEADQACADAGSDALTELAANY